MPPETLPPLSPSIEQRKARADAPTRAAHLWTTMWSQANALLLRRRRGALWADLLILVAGSALLFGFVRVGREWTGVHRPAIQLDLSPRALPMYTFFSLVRGLVAYVTLAGLHARLRLLGGQGPARREGARARCSTFCRASPCSASCPAWCSRWSALFPQQQRRPRARRRPDDLHRPGLEHDVQLLSLAEVGAGRPCSEAATVYRLQLVAAVHVGRAAVRDDRPGLEQHDEHGRRLVLPDDQRERSCSATTTSAFRGSART